MIRRALPVALGVVIVVGGILGLLAYFNSRDAAGVSADAAATGPGTLEPDRGAAHVAGAGVGERALPPPTSGPHAPRNVTTEPAVDDAALLHALELGDVVLAYPQPAPPAALKRLQDDVAGPFDPELAAAGQSVILVRRSGLAGIQALAWRRRLNATGPDDPQLRAFADAWLGKGRGNTG